MLISNEKYLAAIEYKKININTIKSTLFSNHYK